ncbi:tyrosine-type recombinase/integrase [Aminivibrio sp.]|uniref:tyrosine-type recombinase/integrase n=1 Tax=Aminivibrio sp. TaxID=1872489 RepID=UPI001A4949B5|nr:tyrosine-type recombinase/integrase [Aminivibrio sp.]MBL3538518.1 tyrosine-type recombinase/integrase [Aminivibrio sp.]
MNLTPEEKDERVKLLHEEALLLTDKYNPSWDDSVESVALARDHSLHLTPDEETEKEAINEVYGDTKQHNNFWELFEGKRRIIPVTSEKSPETEFSQREIDLMVELLIANDWAFLEKKLLASDHRIVEGYNLGISMEVEDLTLYLLVRKKNFRNILKARAFTDLYNVRKLIPHTNRHFPSIAQKFVSGALANCDRALRELNGILPPESVQIAYRSEHPVVPPAVSVNNTTPLPTVGPDYEDPEIATLVQEIIAEKTTSKARKEVRWTEKTRGEFESKFKFILRYFGQGRKVSEITKEHLTELMDIFNTRLSARQGQKMEDLDPNVLLRGKIPEEKISNATVEKWTTALNMILKRGHDFYPRALKVPYSIVKKEVVLPDKEQKFVRLTYSPDDLQKLFDSTFVTDSLKGGKAIGTPAYFLFGALTGARAEELGQLCRGDIFTADGILCLRIDENAEMGTRVKNKASKRTIPVPEPLVRIMQFLMIEKEETDNIWGFTKGRGTKASFSRNAARWWNTYVKERLGEDAAQTFPNGQTGVKVFHSFRHTIASVGKTIGIEKCYTSEILGHEPSDATKNTTTHYESKFSPSELAPKMKSIYDALEVDWKTVADKVLAEMVKRRNIS